mmetsp:Transcript_50659/g.42689  ORF Transcript_50659/g.42689 Transcript_50659/m.42689 type:complete len:204 (-) Transcript_50659:263-874(-)
MRQNSNDVSKLPSEIILDLEKMTNTVTEVGLVNLAFVKDLVNNWLISLVKGSKDIPEEHIFACMETFKVAAKALLALPMIMEEYVKLMIKPCELQLPSPEMMAEANQKLTQVQRGITPEGNFWMMQKLNLDLSNLDKVSRPSNKDIKSSLQTINRFSSTEKVYRSNDILTVIDKMMRGENLNRNFLRDIQMIFFMTKGDLFLD